MAESKKIVITDQIKGLPYSKGLMSSSLMVSGLPAAKAYELAEQIEAKLIESKRFELTGEELRATAAEMLTEVGERYAVTYLKWQEVSDLDKPLILLIGGGTGVGKSTIATQLAATLGITRAISTDAVREVLRSGLSQQVIPTLYESSFEAGDALRGSLPKSADRLIIGFQEQVRAVAVGVKSLITRAIEEGTDMIIEGAHVVPGFLDEWRPMLTGAVLVRVVVKITDEELHRSHFYQRAQEGRSERHNHYLDNFDKIREIQEYILNAAEERGTPIIEAFDLDATLEELVSLVVETATSAAEDETETEGPIEVRKETRKPGKVARLKSWETLSGRRKS